MPYLNLDDGFAEHAKNEALTDAAFRLHVTGLCYCARELTDGFIVKNKAHRLTEGGQKAAKELVQAGHWYDRGHAYEIHDYLEWNQSKEWWLDRRQKETERKAKYRAQREAEKAQKNGVPMGQNTGHDAGQPAGRPTAGRSTALGTEPDQTRPEPDQKVLSQGLSVVGDQTVNNVEVVGARQAADA